jgi:hypothetical protein
MRLTFSDIQAQHLRNINLVGSTDTNILADFAYNLGQRYQLALAKLANYRTVQTYTFQTGMNVILLSSGASQVISSITSVSTTATVTTAVAHGLTTSNIVQITGVSPTGYNGTYTITVTGTTTFTYTLAAAIISSGTVSQSYPFPLGEVTIEGMVITIGSVNYPLRPLLSRWNNEQLNAIQIQASAVPQFYFVERDTFQVWPTPQATYTGTIYYHLRDRNLSVPDYTTGTVALTQNSTKLTGSGTTFTSAMVGRWFSVTDTTIAGQGYWFRIAGYTSATVLTLSQAWQQATTSGATYRIGESPEIPEEGHQIFAAGTSADYYGGMQKDPTNQAYYDNLFWTGNPSNANRTLGDKNIVGGLLGLMDSYSDRDNRHIVKRKPRLNPLQYKVWSTTLS